MVEKNKKRKQTTSSPKTNQSIMQELKLPYKIN